MKLEFLCQVCTSGLVHETYSELNSLYPLPILWHHVTTVKIEVYHMMPLGGKPCITGKPGKYGKFTSWVLVFLYKLGIWTLSEPVGYDSLVTRVSVSMIKDSKQKRLLLLLQPRFENLIPVVEGMERILWHSEINKRHNPSLLTIAGIKTLT